MPDETKVRVVVYDLATGRIDHANSGVRPDLVAAQAGPAQGALVSDVADGAGWWVDDGVLRQRAPLLFDKLVIAADGVDVARLEKPGAFTVTLDGQDHAVEDVVEISSDMPAIYQLVIDDEAAFPFLPLEVEIIAA